MSNIRFAIQQWQERRKAIRDIASMPDHLLADIGIERHRIPDIVRTLQAQRLGAASPGRPLGPIVPGGTSLSRA